MQSACLFKTSHATSMVRTSESMADSPSANCIRTSSCSLSAVLSVHRIRCLHGWIQHTGSLRIHIIRSISTLQRGTFATFLNSLQSHDACTRQRFWTLVRVLQEKTMLYIAVFRVAPLDHFRSPYIALRMTKTVEACFLKRSIRSGRHLLNLSG